MKRFKTFAAVWSICSIALFSGAVLSGCSALFDVYNTKTGDSSLSTGDSANTNISSGLVMIKASRPNLNQITYNASQTTYYVGTVPENYSDSTFEETGYTNGSTTRILAKDNPVEFRCFANDSHATVEWTAIQTWQFNPEYSNISTDANGNDVSRVISEEAEALENPKTIPFNRVSGFNDNSRIRTVLPYGVTEITCKITADDDYYTSTYRIIVTKSYISDSANAANANTITDSGLAVISAAEPDVNKITFQNNIYDYTVRGITGSDNDMAFRFFPADYNTQVEWSIRQTQTFIPVTETSTTTARDENLDADTEVTTITVTGQTSSPCNNEIDFTVDETFSGNKAIYATIPYGVTEVKATVTPSGELPLDYTITLRRNIIDDTSSTSEIIGNYSKLSDISVDVTAGSDTSIGTLTPEFNPNTTTYTLEVNEEADSITIDATPAEEDAVISDPVSITKYGTVPNINGKTVPLVGGTSKITFTVTDETEVSRTYTIYAVKPTDGDTSLSSLTYTPQNSFANGVKGFTFTSSNSSFAGATAESIASSGTAKYAVTLSADSRIDVTSMAFTAVPKNRRTTVAYGVSSSINTLPEEWTDNVSRAVQTGSSPVSHTVEIGNEDTQTVKRILWVKTISDEYYHRNDSGYETEKRADTMYHTVEISKAGDANQDLTAMVVVATDENGNKTTVLTQKTSTEVAYKTIAASKNITTYADKLDFYFRPLDKDAAVTYSAKNTAYAGSSENTSFTGYSADATSDGIEKIFSCSELNDGASEYYHFSLGEIVKGTGISSNTKDIPNGTTEVTICGVTYTFVKPNLTDTRYTLSGWENAGSGNGGVDSSSRASYIYIKHEVTSVVLSLNVTQQNAEIKIKRDGIDGTVEQTADSNSTTVTEPSNASYAVLHKKTASDGQISDKWKVSIGNATTTDAEYDTVETGNDDTTTEIPVGTTTVKLYVSNNGTNKDYTFYIVRADDNEARLKTLTLTNPEESTETTTVSADIAPSAFNWESTAESNTYVLSTTPYLLDKGTITLKAKAVSENAEISVTRRHSEGVNLTSVGSNDWTDAVDVENTSSSGNSTFTGSYTITENDSGTLLFTVTVTARNGNTHVYNLLAYVKADTKAELTALNIVQNGSRNGSTDDYTNPILANSFRSDEYTYDDLCASLSYTGDIVVTPTVYEKASISTSDVKLNGTSIKNESGITAEDNGEFRVAYDYYKNQLGKSLVFSYSIQAQDTNVATVTYTATVAIPELTTVTEVTRQTISTEYSYEVPATNKTSRLAYRFGSVIADRASFLGPKPEENKPGYFGGIDITGTNDNSTWYESSFGQSGFQLVMNADGTDYWVALDESGSAVKFYTVDFSGKTVTELSSEQVAELGIGLCVEPEFKYEGETPYLALNFNVTNSSGKNVKLGASIDTLVGTIAESTEADNDRVSVEETDNGFIMNGTNYTFSVCLKNAFGVDDVDRIWYGAYNNTDFTHMSVFEDKNSELPDGTDSAASFSWDLGSESSYTKTIRINMHIAQ